MKMTSRCEYAFLALIYIARKYPDTIVSVAEISRHQKIPRKFLEQILLILKRSRYLTSTRGQGGGYQLAMPPQKITLAEIARLFDGALAPTNSVSKYFYQSTPVEKEKKLLVVFKDIRNYVAKKLEKTTLADML